MFLSLLLKQLDISQQVIYHFNCQLSQRSWKFAHSYILSYNGETVPMQPVALQQFVMVQRGEGMI